MTASTVWIMGTSVASIPRLRGYLKAYGHRYESCTIPPIVLHRPSFLPYSFSFGSRARAPDGNRLCPPNFPAPPLGPRSKPRSIDTFPPGRSATFPSRRGPAGSSGSGLIGPGIVLAGTSIGSGEWLFGPAVTAQYGAALLWLALISILLQGFCNLTMMRYTVYSGEPIIVGGLQDLARPTVLDDLLGHLRYRLGLAL